MKKQKGLTLLELSVVLLVLIALAGIAIPYVGGTGRMAACKATDATLHAVKEAIMGGASGPGLYSDLLGQYPRDKFNNNGYSLRYLFERDDELDNDGDLTIFPIFDPDDQWSPYNPKTGVGWNGPYLNNPAFLPAGLNASFSNVHDSALNPNGTVNFDILADGGSQVLDAWHRPIILQIPYDATLAIPAYVLEFARLVSAGPGGGFDPSNSVINTQINDVTAANRGDDRVLFLRRPDPSSNEPCVQD